MSIQPSVDALTKVFTDHPALVEALEQGDDWRNDDGAITFNVEVPTSSEVVAGFEAMANLFDTPLDHLSADARPMPIPPGRPMTFAELARNRPVA